LGKPADVYLFDEPSNYLDVEQRLIAAKVIKKFIMNANKYCFLVEHDIIMSTYMADKVIVFSKDKQVNQNNQNKQYSIASVPLEYMVGFNLFFKSLNITLRRGRSSLRPRINKLN